MRIQKLSILFAILSMPLFASAHGEDVLFTFALSFILGVIYLIILTIFKSPIFLKLIALAVYVCSIVAVYYFINDMPYNDNKIYINTIVALIPTSVAIASLFVLWFFKKSR